MLGNKKYGMLSFLCSNTCKGKRIKECLLDAYDLESWRGAGGRPGGAYLSTETSVHLEVSEGSCLGPELQSAGLAYAWKLDAAALPHLKSLWTWETQKRTPAVENSHSSM